jgi:hypothetical protein
MLSPKALDKSLGLRSSGRRNATPYGPRSASFTGTRANKAPTRSATKQKTTAASLNYSLQRDPKTGSLALLIEEVQ